MTSDDHTDKLGDEEPSEKELEELQEIVDGHRDLFERIAAADLPVSHRYRAVLEYLDNGGSR